MASSVRPVRVLVADDSARLRSRIVAALSADPGIEVVGQAGDGRSAIDRCLELRPDVVTMDVILSGITGVAVTEQLMQRCPTPILIISAATDPGELVNTFAALAAGAVDVLEKPRAGSADDVDWNRRLVSTVKLVARIQVITHLAKGAGHSPKPAEPPPVMSMPPRSAPRSHASPVTPVHRQGAISVVGIGASTGGPAAVVEVLSSLPTTFPLPVLLVLHVSDHFGPAIVNWLNDVTGRPVRLAQAGESISALGGQVIMAPPGRHLAVRGGVLRLNQDPERHSCRPSVDVLFESLADEFGPQVVACLLTGMGKDGATGLLDVHRSGGLTIAQDETSSVVFGMPGEAVRLGAAQHVLPIDEIGPTLGRLTAVEEGSR